MLKKTSNKFLSFFQAKATPGGTPGRADASAVTPVQPGASSQQQGGASQLGGGGSQQQQGAEGTATGKREKGYCELFLKPEGANLRRCVCGCLCGSRSRGASPAVVCRLVVTCAALCLHVVAVLASLPWGREGGCHSMPPPALPFPLCSLPPQPSAAERMDAAAGQPFAFEAAQAEWQQLLQGMKRRRREAAAQVG